MITIAVRHLCASALLLGTLLLNGCTSQPPATSKQTEQTAPAVISAAGVTVEEYPLTDDATQSRPLGPELWKRIEPFREKRKTWREPTPAMREQYASLQPGIPHESRPDLYDQSRRMIRQPYQVGEDIIYLRYDPQTVDIQVVKNEQVVYTYTHPKAQFATAPSALVEGFFIWDGKWVMETVEGHLIVEGKDLNQELGYDEIFGFHFLQGKPFYFFRQKEQFGISYDGQVLPVRYQQVPHYGCCDGEMYNPQPNGWMVTFYAIRDGQWRYVELGKYE